MAIAYMSAGHGSHTYYWYKKNHPEALTADNVTRDSIRFMTDDAATRRRVLNNIGIGDATVVGREDVVAGEMDSAAGQHEASRQAAEKRKELFGEDEKASTGGGTLNSGDSSGSSTAVTGGSNSGAYDDAGGNYDSDGSTNNDGGSGEPEPAGFFARLFAAIERFLRRLMG